MKHPAIQVIFRLLLVLLLTVIGLFLLYHFLRLTYPFLIAALLAYLIHPLILIFERYLRFPRPLAILTSILFLIGIVGGLVTVLIKLSIDGILYLSEFIPKQIEIISVNLQNFFNQVVLPLWDQGIGLFDGLDANTRQALQEGFLILGNNAATMLGSIGQGIANGITSFIGALPITFTVIIFSILAIYFISKDSNKYAMLYREKLPSIFREKTWDVVRDLRRKTLGFIKSQFIMMTLTLIVSLLGLFFLRVENALTLAVILGILDLIPYFGPGLVLIPWSLYSFFTGNIFMGIGLLVLYASTVTVRQFAEPKVLSSSMKLNPLAILISLFAGLQLFGVIGLVIGPITLVIIISLHEAKVFEGLWEFIKGGPSRSS